MYREEKLLFKSIQLRPAGVVLACQGGVRDTTLFVFDFGSDQVPNSDRLRFVLQIC